jgi:FtsP/CotA-like multicopper oxidase with cupredoxin domain
VLPPGGRTDVLVRCTQGGKHRLVSGARPGASGLFSSDLLAAPLLAHVVVDDDDDNDGDRHAGHELEPTPFVVDRPSYLTDMRAIGEGAAPQFNFSFQDVNLVDNASSHAAKLIYPFNGDESGTCTFNGRTFHAGVPLLSLPLNSVNTWRTSGVQGHPLHMHVNPMQILSIERAVPVRLSTGVMADCDDEFGVLCVGDWVDTLMLPRGDGDTAHAVVRWTAKDFVGNIVLHCHYLQHEDQGCLTYVDITGPAQADV